MWRTRVGYAGGTGHAPTYRAIQDHTECFQVDFDPDVITYDELLGYVWADHDPTRAAYKTQYASLVLTHDDEQLDLATASASALERSIGRAVITRIEPLSTFWVAEDYHQKYYLRNDRALMEEFRQMYGDDEAAFRESPTAARVNGYVAGAGASSVLGREIGAFGLSARAMARLQAGVGMIPTGSGCPL